MSKIIGFYCTHSLLYSQSHHGRDFDSPRDGPLLIIFLLFMYLVSGDLAQQTTLRMGGVSLFYVQVFWGVPPEGH